jgi:hypothetical protein
VGGIINAISSTIVTKQMGESGGIAELLSTKVTMLLGKSDRVVFCQILGRMDEH